jgi:hypothetical protein
LLVPLLESLYLEVSCAHVDSGSVGGLADLQLEAIDRERVQAEASRWMSTHPLS